MNKTPLHIALEMKSKEISELFITKGANVNAKDFHCQKKILLN